MMKKQQLEMGFENSIAFRPPSASRTRRAKARWWFHQMRLVVDQACDCSAPDESPIEPVTIGGGRRR